MEPRDYRALALSTFIAWPSHTLPAYTGDYSVLNKSALANLERKGGTGAQLRREARVGMGS